MTFRPGAKCSYWTFVGGNVPPPTNAAEIDIFETIVSNLQQAPNALSTCVHTCYNCNKPPSQHHYLSNFDYRNWHTYAIEWDADKITWYVDGKSIRTSANRDWDNNGNSVINPVRIILSTKVSPDYLLNSDSFEEYMYVDYVKVYQLKCSSAVVNEISNFNEYCYTVKKSISLSSATTIPAGENITLRATDYIELANGFEVPPNTELYLDVNPCSEPYFPCPVIREGEDE